MHSPLHDLCTNCNNSVTRYMELKVEHVTNSVKSYSCVYLLVPFAITTSFACVTVLMVSP